MTEMALPNVANGLFSPEPASPAFMLDGDDKYLDVFARDLLMQAGSNADWVLPELDMVRLTAAQLTARGFATRSPRTRSSVAALRPKPGKPAFRHFESCVGRELLPMDAGKRCSSLLSESEPASPSCWIFVLRPSSRGARSYRSACRATRHTLLDVSLRNSPWRAPSHRPHALSWACRLSGARCPLGAISSAWQSDI